MVPRLPEFSQLRGFSYLMAARPTSGAGDAGDEDGVRPGDRRAFSSRAQAAVALRPIAQRWVLRTPFRPAHQSAISMVPGMVVAQHRGSVVSGSGASPTMGTIGVAVLADLGRRSMSAWVTASGANESSLPVTRSSKPGTQRDQQVAALQRRHGGHRAMRACRVCRWLSGNAPRISAWATTGMPVESSASSQAAQWLHRG